MMVKFKQNTLFLSFSASFMQFSEGNSFFAKRKKLPGKSAVLHTARSRQARLGGGLDTCLRHRRSARRAYKYQECIRLTDYDEPDIDSKAYGLKKTCRGRDLNPYGVAPTGF